MYARRAEPGDYQRVAALLGQLHRLGDRVRASAALVAFRDKRGPHFRDKVRELLDELAPARRATIEAARRWAERAIEAMRGDARGVGGRLGANERA
jgi:hypothetical protein